MTIGLVMPASAARAARIAFAAVSLALLAAPGAAAGDAVTAVTTPGIGAFTVCRNWIVFNSCNTYGKVPVPARIAVGDKIKLSYGSNPKDYIFHVVGIRRDDKGCTILSDASGSGEDTEKLRVGPCQPAAPAAAR